MGGTSSEHFISMVSGKAVFNAIDKSKYRVKPIIITREGNWIIPEGFDSVLPDWKLDPEGSNVSEFITEFSNVNKIKSHKGIGVAYLDCDAVFIALHGGEGEDGTTQGLLSSFGIPYTGSAVLASALAMDKERANYIFSQVGLHVPKFVSLEKKDYDSKKVNLNSVLLKYPIFVKPMFGGSSVGVSKVENPTSLEEVLRNLFDSTDRIILQEQIKGTEVSCSVLEEYKNGDLFINALPPTEIIPETDFFDYKAKYTGKSREITPARLPHEITKVVQNSALKAHQSLGCKSYSRTDFIIYNDIPYILETNTLPGLTEGSLLPQQAKSIGKSLTDIINILIQSTFHT